MYSVKRFQTYLESKSSVSDPIFRILLSLIFIIGGLGHFVQHRQMLERMAESPWVNTINAIGNPSVLLWLSGTVFLVAGIALAFGFMTRMSSALLFLTLVPVTFTVHVAPGHAGPLFKNIAILGALIHFFFKGSGAFAIDGLFSKSPKSTVAPSAKDLVAKANMEIETVSAETAVGLMSDPSVQLIDLREKEELEKSGKLKNALHVPRGLLEFQADPASPSHNSQFNNGKRLVLYCGSGARSALAVKTLTDMGVQNVCHVAGGFAALQKAGSVLEK